MTSPVKNNKCRTWSSVKTMFERPSPMQWVRLCPHWLSLGCHSCLVLLPRWLTVLQGRRTWGWKRHKCEWRVLHCYTNSTNGLFLAGLTVPAFPLSQEYSRSSWCLIADPGLSKTALVGIDCCLSPFFNSLWGGVASGSPQDSSSVLLPPLASAATWQSPCFLPLKVGVRHSQSHNLIQPHLVKMLHGNQVKS